MTTTPNNSIFTIRPFKIGSIWAFTDEGLGLHNESFVGDINNMIDAMLQRADLPASEPFTGMFSASRFPGHHMLMTWLSEEGGGNWYYDKDTNLEGWLCPALFAFFCSAPASIYVRAEK